MASNETSKYKLSVVEGTELQLSLSGSAGPAGPSNVLSIGTVTTVESNVPAAANITGSSPSQVLSLTLPKGNTGATGSQGVQGIQGIQGPQGLAGDKYQTTSSTNLLIPAIGSTITITVGTGLSYSTNQNVLISHDIGNHIHAEIDSYNPTTGVMVAVVTDTDGSGTYSSWSVNLSGAVGAVGPQGIQGPQGTQGVQGIQGIQGATGPNSVTTSTTTNITGIIKGNGSVVSQAVAGTDYVTAAALDLKSNLSSPTFTGVPLSTTAAVDTNTTQIATTAYVIGQVSTTTPAAIGTAAVGTSLKYARADHVHAIDTIKAEGGGIVVIGTSNPTASGANTGVDSLISGFSSFSNTGSYCSISGFNNNSNSGSNCSISGRANYSNSGSNCSISGRFNHTNSGNYGLISGRDNYSNSGSHCQISGLNNNFNFGNCCQISGSSNGSNSGNYCQISGFNNSSNSGNLCQISGSFNGSNSGSYCQISGSANDSNSGDYCQISGESNTSNSGSRCQISGGNNYSNFGNNCSISGSSNHTNSGYGCSISGYSNRTNSGAYCSISGYGNYSNSGNNCSISGYNNHSNTGNYCSISGRNNGSNSGAYCQISGYYADFNALSYARVHGGSLFSRIIDIVAKAATTDATPTTLTLGGAAEGVLNRIYIPANSTWSFTATVVARETATANAKTFTRRGLIGNNAGAVTISSLDTIGTDHVLGTLAATVAITADDPNDALKIVGTGVASKNIKWTAQVNITQVG
jgi:hypothetical protein